MNKLRFAALFLAPATPLFAQSAQPASPQTVPATPTPLPPAIPMPKAMPGMQEPPMMPSTAVPPAEPAKSSMPQISLPEPTVADVVAADFPKYDKDASGELSRAEFMKWVGEAKAKADGKAPARKTLMQSFMKADADKSRSVSQSELTAFLS